MLLQSGYFPNSSASSPCSTKMGPNKWEQMGTNRFNKLLARSSCELGGNWMKLIYIYILPFYNLRLPWRFSGLHNLFPRTLTSLPRHIFWCLKGTENSEKLVSWLEISTHPAAALKKTISGWWFGCHQFYFPINIGNFCHHPNWRTHIFQRGGKKNHQPDIVKWYPMIPRELFIPSEEKCLDIGVVTWNCIVTSQKKTPYIAMQKPRLVWHILPIPAEAWKTPLHYT